MIVIHKLCSFLLLQCVFLAYQGQSCTARGSISLLTAKLGQSPSSGGDWNFAACQGQGMQHLGSFLCFDLEQERECCCLHLPPGAFKKTQIFLCAIKGVDAKYFPKCTLCPQVGVFSPLACAIQRAKENCKHSTT